MANPDKIMPAEKEKPGDITKTGKKVTPGAVSYKRTLVACYVGYVVQAANINLFAVMFIPLRDRYGLTYTQFGTLIFIIFLAQLLVSILMSKAADRFGTRPFLFPALGINIFGLIFLAVSPFLMPGRIFAGFMLATFMFSAGGGLIELCLSPIVDAIPSDAADSSKALAFLHSFYAWGQAGVVLITSALLFIGVPWQVIAALWALVPIADIFLFAGAPVAEKATGENAMKISVLLRERVFIVALLAIISGGAAEAIIAQYASPFLEKGLGLSKITGDILGLCGFAMFLGAGRLVYGLMGHKLDIHKALIAGSALAFAAYLVIILSPANAPAVLAIALCGLFVSLLWPGTLAIASKKLPHAGASLFALLTAAGSLGCSVGPWASGVVTDMTINYIKTDTAQAAEQIGLRLGVLVGALFAAISFTSQFIMKKKAGPKHVQKI